jgi:hypothetical protein
MTNRSTGRPRPGWSGYDDPKPGAWIFARSEWNEQPRTELLDHIKARVGPNSSFKSSADAPFDRKEGDESALHDAEIADVTAFLKTRTDGCQSEQR